MVCTYCISLAFQVYYANSRSDSGLYQHFVKSTSVVNLEEIQNSFQGCVYSDKTEVARTCECHILSTKCTCIWHSVYNTDPIVPTVHNMYIWYSLRNTYTLCS